MIEYVKEQYAIYLRKSRADVEAEKLGDGETLARHRKILVELAARKGFFVGEIYQEIISGAERIEDRPEINRLIKDCYAGKWVGVLVVEVTRLSRGSQGDAQIIMDCLRYANRNKGVLVVTPTKTYDIAHNPDDEEYMEFELFMSRREYKMIKRRMDRGREQAVVEGNYMGSYRPYGYDILKTKTSRTLIPNEDEAPIVKKIFEWTVTENISPRKIAERLDNMGIPTYSGGEWSTSTIKTILTNPTYIGKVRWNDRMQVKTMQNGEMIKSRPRSNHTEKYMEFDGKHKQHALIDEETFKKASERFYSDRTKADFKLTNPLAGLLVCKECGHAMVYQAYKNKPNVAPRYCHRQSTRCKVKSVMASDVINALVHSLKLYLEDFEIMVDNLPDVDENELQAQINALQRKADTTKKKLSKAFDDYEDGIYTANEFVERKEKHKTTLERIEKQIIELENSIPEKEEYEETAIMLSEALDYLLDESIDAEIKNEYLKRIIDRIEFSRENGTEFMLDVFLK